MYDKDDYNGEQMNKVESGSLTVIGKGVVEAAPDAAEIQLEVRTESKRPQKAEVDNSVIMTRVIQSLLQMGIQREQIQTSSYRMNPQYDYVDGEQVFRGYEVVHVITVSLNQINQVGQVIETAVEHGVTGVSDIRFKVTHPGVYDTHALQIALQDAHMKAHAMADTMKVSLYAAPSDVKETSAVYPETYQTYAATNKSIEIPIEPGQIEFNASVTSTYTYTFR